MTDSRAATEFLYHRRVEFADTDTANVIHFSAFFRYMEEAEHAFYRSLGGLAFEWREDGVVGMPRVAASCDFLAPVRYGDELMVRLIVREVRNKAIRYAVEFERAGPEEDRVVARGTMTVVYAERAHGERDWRGAPLPDDLRAKLAPAPEESG
ncbi:MAG: thioesterase family protein [Gemmatimonadota bacterium]|nr:thioesterase family protein [Gemmatimonadota bacterium]